MVSSDRNDIVANRTTENRNGDPAAGDGIFVDAASRGNLVKGNSASTNSDDGIDVRSASTRLVDNVATANDDLGMTATVGIAVEAPCEWERQPTPVPERHLHPIVRIVPQYVDARANWTQAVDRLIERLRAR